MRVEEKAQVLAMVAASPLQRDYLVRTDAP